MLERAPEIYEVELYGNQKSISETKIPLILGRDGGRSLMMDTGFRKQRCLESMEEALASLGITYDRLDIFPTHKHHGHCGPASVYVQRGARLFMNLQEDRHCYDCLYYSYSHGFQEDQPEVLRAVGVTETGTPQVWNTLMEVNRRVNESKGWELEIPGFAYTPVKAGQVLSYGGYDFETVLLKGHIFEQMGLRERKRRILFCADQVIDGIVPIVGTTYPDEYLLKGYLESLEHFKHEYKDCLVLSTHKEPIEDVKRVVNRIVSAYLDKTDLIKYTLDHGYRRMATKEVACLAYGTEPVPKDEAEFIELKMVINKTSPCLEYLYDEDFTIRSREDGIFYWEAPQRVEQTEGPHGGILMERLWAPEGTEKHTYMFKKIVHNIHQQ